MTDDEFNVIVFVVVAIAVGYGLCRLFLPSAIHATPRSAGNGFFWFGVTALVIVVLNALTGGHFATNY
jgi:hypothetical protein